MIVTSCGTIIVFLCNSYVVVSLQSNQISIISHYKCVILILNVCLVKLSFSCSESLIEHFCCQHKSISGFISHALWAADEAWRNANWLPSEIEKKERTVSFPSVETHPLSIWARFYRLFWLKCFRSVSTGIINLFHHMLLIYFIIRYTIKKNIVEKHMLASIFDFLQHKIWDCIILSCPELLCMAWFDDSCKNSSYG